MIIFIVTFSLFFIEALLHYNYGHTAKEFVLPDYKSLLQIIYTVALFSYLNSKILKYLSKYYHLHN